MSKFYCDSINQDICRYFHPHTKAPECNGYCGEYYEHLLIKDMRKDIKQAKGNLDSFRGGILISTTQQGLVRELYKRIQEAEQTS